LEKGFSAIKADLYVLDAGKDNFGLERGILVKNSKLKFFSMKKKTQKSKKTKITETQS